MKRQMEVEILSNIKRNVIMLNRLIKTKEALPGYSIPAIPSPKKFKQENNEV